jgi:Autographiviridae endonuclease VII
VNDLAPMERRCSTCTETKLITEFTVDNSRRYGYKYECKICSDAKRRMHEFKRRYGITVQQYDEMVMAQCGTCAVCGEPETALAKSGETKRLAVHHNHDSGKVIALLCYRCNIGMGNLQDNPVFLRNAAQLMEEVV